MRARGLLVGLVCVRCAGIWALRGEGDLNFLQFNYSLPFEFEASLDLAFTSSQQEKNSQPYLISQTLFSARQSSASRRSASTGTRPVLASVPWPIGDVIPFASIRCAR